MTQRELAELLNVSSQAVSKWENNRGYPDVSLIAAMSKIFEVSIDQLFGF
jgi:tellurite methyltransferase